MGRSGCTGDKSDAVNQVPTTFAAIGAFGDAPKRAWYGIYNDWGIWEEHQVRPDALPWNHYAGERRSERYFRLRG